eukprot:TRINITY_DN26865_c0_g1_i1.p1 TRINITY_DN26865_c0_g1~~TRINITY_DN26865_c0_g1_i1.p1  ORF type:complete len:188 (-),score=33.61 TRINITY_DN26865_c0_g1_i1:262-825(-)
MFVLSLLHDDLHIPPQHLSLPLHQAVWNLLHARYVDKVVKDLGLCVTLYDVQRIEGGYVLPSEGAPSFSVTFRLVMFRPFVGEVMTGKLKSCDESGLHLSLDFFSDIFVPDYYLQLPSVFDAVEKLWYWKYCEEEMYLDLEDTVRFRVAQVKFPPLPLEQAKDAKPFAPMEITADINADGLGPVTWW